MNREHRNLLLDGQLVLISPYDPSAGFNVGNAMQRNKLIYALADTSLVVSSDLNKGGTWAGAVEQLDKLKFVRSSFDRRASLLPDWMDYERKEHFLGRTRKTWIRSRTCSTWQCQRRRHPHRLVLRCFQTKNQRRMTPSQRRPCHLAPRHCLRPRVSDRRWSTLF